MKSLYLLFFVLAMLSCGTMNNPYLSKNAQNETTVSDERTPVHTLYLIGDTGDVEAGESNYVLPILQSMLEQENENSSTVFLGDQLYPTGMPKKDNPKRAEAERILDEQLAIFENYQGKAFFIPGERDWNNKQEKGLKALLRQEKYLENYYDEKGKVRMYPGQGCGDPKVVKINKDLVFVFLDTQWWLQNWSGESKINEGCEIKSRHDLATSIQEIFTEHKNDQVVVMMHHPMYSNGTHGGRFGLKEHLLPFREPGNVNIPLPVIGSLVPLYRNTVGGQQDLANNNYQELMQEMEAVAAKVGMHAIFASAHDNSLQHFSNYKLQYIVSGSGSRTNYTGKGGDAFFAQEARGFCKVVFYEEFETWLEMYTVAGPGQEAVLVYKTELRAPRPGTEDIEEAFPPVTLTDTILPANAVFAAGRTKSFFWGEQYRTIWTQEVKAPVIDLEDTFGGLRPIKKGGGMSSNSLRMEVDNGKQYILRSINKDYRKLVPPDFANLKLINVFQDQNSASHPYGALAIPALSRAANVYYTSPQLVYLQHQRGLGNYNSQFPEELYLLEQRPSGDWSDAEQFGFSEEIIGYTDLLATLRDKKTHFVDQEWVCKSRMFDLLIHDWDRHDDQWRWASFEEDDRTLYRPIPRDRDQVFYKFEGLLPSYIAAFIVKKFKTMKEDVRDVKNQSFNARYFDRYFLNELEWSEWERIIDELQANVTDAAIDEAMNAFPEETRGEDDQEIARLLRARRANLKDIGRRLYAFISREVEVTGSDNDDRFEITTMDDGSTKVQVFVERKSKGDLLKYERTFYPSETKEVRLFGLRGKDIFNFNGDNNNAIRVRVIGGEDDDQANNEAGRKAFVYDETEGIEMQGNGLRNRTSRDSEVNDYDRYGFRYNSNLPLLALGYTLDDKLWIGASTSWTKHGWRRYPYKSKQKVSFLAAPGTRNAYQFAYEGHFPKVLGIFDFAPSVDFNAPRYENYFGLGNESVNFLREIEYSWVRLETFEINPYLQLNSKDGTSRFRFGPTFETNEIELTDGRVSTDPVLGFSEADLERREFLGLGGDMRSGFVDNEIAPSNGFMLGANLKLLKSLYTEEDVTNWGINAQAYLTLLTRPQIVLANNIGYEQVLGEPQFYQYADLGNTTNLRGFRNNRFRGETAFYHNIDLRVRLAQWNNRVLPMDVGILTGYDYGRVGIDDVDSDIWHNSQTLGVWFNILGLAVLQPYYSFTDEENTFTFKMGFNF